MKKLLPHSAALSVRLLAGWAAAADQPAIPGEARADAQRRHERVAARRKAVHIICHRSWR
jgi:hypothetical protein